MSRRVLYAIKDYASHKYNILHVCFNVLNILLESSVYYFACVCLRVTYSINGIYVILESYAHYIASML